MFQSWVLAVEDGEAPEPTTTWLVEMTSILKTPTATVPALYTTACETLNYRAIAGLCAAGAKIPADRTNGLVKVLLQGIHWSIHRHPGAETTNKCSRALQEFMRVVRPSASVCFNMLLHVVSFSACCVHVDNHLQLVDAVLGAPSAWWQEGTGAIVCALRWSPCPRPLVELLRARGIDSLAPPSWEFDAVQQSTPAAHSSVFNVLPVRLAPCAKMRWQAIPAVLEPFHIYACLFARVRKLVIVNGFENFVALVELMHDRSHRSSVSCEELQSTARTLLRRLLGEADTLELAGSLLKSLGKLMPPDLREHMPADTDLYALSPLVAQLALVRRGVSAEKYVLQMEISTADFVDMRMRIALAFALAGAQISPATPCWHKWAIEVATARTGSAPRQFVGMCDYDYGAPMPDVPRFAQWAVRSMLVYGRGTDGVTELSNLMDAMGFRAARNLALQGCSKFTHLAFRQYPVSCRVAVRTFLAALRKSQLRALPTEVLLKILETCNPFSLGRCDGPWAPGEPFPLVSVELNTLAESAGVVQRIGVL